MLELDCEEVWALKNWCFWTVVLEKTLESPLDCKEIQPVHSEGDQPWDLFGRNDVKAESPVLWPPHVKSWLIGKDSDVGRDWGQEEKGMTEDEMAWWHHQLDGRKFEWTPGVGDGQAWHAAIHGVSELDRTEQLNWTELIDVAEQLRYCYLLKASIIWPVDANSWLIGKDYDAGKDWGQKEKRMSEAWHHHGMMAWMTSPMQ